MNDLPTYSTYKQEHCTYKQKYETKPSWNIKPDSTDHVIKTAWTKSSLFGRSYKKKISITSDGELIIQTIAQNSFYRLLNSLGKFVPWHWKSLGNSKKEFLIGPDAEATLKDFSSDTVKKVVYIQRVSLYNALERLQMDIELKLAELEDKRTSPSVSEEHLKVVSERIKALKTQLIKIKEYSNEIHKTIEMSRDENKEIPEKYALDKIREKLHTFRDRYTRIIPITYKLSYEEFLKESEPLQSDLDEELPREPLKPNLDLPNLFTKVLQSILDNRLKALGDLSRSVSEFRNEHDKKIRFYSQTNDEIQKLSSQFDEVEGQLHQLIANTNKGIINDKEDVNLVKRCKEIMKKITDSLNELS